MGVRVLFVEDSQVDVDLQLRRLRDAGLEPQWDRVQTEDALRAALADETWEIALVDYNIPGFSGLEALRQIAELAPDLPAITVSGSIDEDTAVATMSAGAVEYVLKDNLTRLAPAVRRAIDAAALRRAHRHAAEAARLALFAVDHASLSIATVAEDGTVVYANDRACRDFFMDREALIGSKLWEIDERMPREMWQNVWQRAVAQGALEFRMARDQPDGGRIVLDTTVNYLEGADLLITYGRDVTARVEAEEQARASEAEYRRMVEMASEGIWAMDGEYRTTFVNERMAQLLALTPADMLGRPVTDFMFDEDLGDHTERMSERREGQPGFYERRFRRGDGSELWTIVSAVASTDDAGGFAGSFGMFTDITDRKLADEALRSERTNLAAIFEASPVAMLVFDEHLNVVRVNRAAMTLATGGVERLLEHRSESVLQCGDLLGCLHCTQDARGCGHTEDCPLCPLRNGLEAVISSGTVLRGLEVAVDLKGDDGVRRVWLRLGAEPLELNGARHVTVALDDITDRRRAEESLRESEERFTQFAEHFPGYFFMQDEDLKYVFVNRPEEQDGDAPRGEWLGHSPSELWEGGEIAIGDQRLRRARDGEVVDVVQPWARSGRQQYLHSIYFPIPRRDGQPLIGGLSLDVTDQVKAEEEVLRSAEQLRRTVEGAVLAMSHVVETRDPYTAGHERRVSELATAIGRELGLEADVLDGLRLAALIHDIGKISIPAEILAKPGRLSDVEFNLIKQHAQAGYDILAEIDFGRPVAEIVLQHHERLDGSGYPGGLSGDGLLTEARILAVADVVEAMSSHRPYRPALGMRAALDEIHEGAGTRYDKAASAACIRVVEEQGFEFTS